MTIPSNATAATAAQAAAWAALAPKVTINSVTIASPPVVNFTVTDANGAAVVGLGNKSKGTSSTSANVAGLTNLSFALAKLVPGTNGAPSKWVSYIVTTVPTNGGTPALPGRPTTDNTGTLVDNGNGSYTYTFYRDVTQVKAQVDGITVPPANCNPSCNKADLGDLTWAPSLVHRLTIQLSGNAPGTGTNTPNGVAFSPAPAVPMQNPVDAIYDFIPATGQVVTASGREIVATAKCNECHRKLGGIPGDDPESSAASFHGSNRNEVRYCVVCHTDQRKYGRVEATLNAATLTFTTATEVIDGRAVGDMPNNIHKTHMGHFLAKKNYNYAGVSYNHVKYPQDLRNCTKCHDGGTDATKNQTAQGNNWKTNPSRLACGACHDGINFATGMGVTIGDALKGLTSTTSFNGFAHGGLAQTDDSQCSTCHTAGNIDVVHTPVTPRNTASFLDGGADTNTNTASIASSNDRLPAGAIKVKYEIKSVSRNSSKQPVIEFRMLQDTGDGQGLRRKDLNVFASTPPSPVTGKPEIWDNFMGSPSVYFVFAVPQDGVLAPADFNASVSGYLRSIWNGAATGTGVGTLSAPDSNGFYTVTLTGVQIPDNATMLTGGVGYSYNVRTTMPLTQINLPNYPTQASTVPVGTSDAAATSSQLLPSMPNRTGGLIVITPNAQRVANGYVGRRQIVEDARCNKCHQELGTFTEEAFHGGQRNDGTTCAWCHTPNRTSSAWSADSAYFVHAVHAGAKRTKAFTWHATGSAAPFESFSEIGYPGVLKECEACHLPGTYDFSSSTNAAGFTTTGGNPSGTSTPSTTDVANNTSVNAVANRLYRTVGQGIYNGVAGTTTPTYRVSAGACVAGTPATQSELGVFSLSLPYVTPLLHYGIGFSYNAGVNPTSASCKSDGTLVAANPAGGTLAPDPTTLVISPITAACSSCHDSVLAREHMRVNGGSFYVPRSTALATIETCMICHDTGRIGDIRAMHAK